MLVTFYLTIKMLPSSSYSILSTAPIRDNFWFANYGSIQVVMMKDCGYINATKLCLLMGKKFSDWKANISSLLLINALESELEAESAYVPNADSTNTSTINLEMLSCKPMHLATAANQTEEDKLISGTYCHPLLIPHIACWCSPSFAIQVARVINYILIEDWKLKLQTSRDLLQNLLLSPPPPPPPQKLKVTTTSNNNTLALLRINDDDKFLPYYIINCGKRSLASAINKLRRRHPNYEVVYENFKFPSGINIFLELKKNNLIKCKRNYCIPIMNEAALINFLVYFSSL